MTRKSFQSDAIRAIVDKDLREYSRDRMWMIMGPILLAAMIAIFWMLPEKAEETIPVGIFPPELARTMGMMNEWDGNESEGDGSKVPGIEILAFHSESELAAAVSENKRGGSGRKKVAAGIAFPANFMTAAGSGEPCTVSIFLDSGLPSLFGRAVASAVRELAYGLRALTAGQHPLAALPVSLPDFQSVILGDDQAGTQIPLREKLKPLMAVLILMIEALALAGLVAVEIEHRTVTAILITPARIGDVLAAKCITGTLLALGQGLFFLILTGSIRRHVFLVLLLTLLGAFMASAVGMIAGAAGRDFMGTLFIGMIFVVPLMIPAFTVIIPGSTAGWIKILPSYGLIQAMVGTIGYGEGWREAVPFILGALLWGSILFSSGLLLLKRRVEAL